MGRFLFIPWRNAEMAEETPVEMTTPETPAAPTEMVEISASELEKIRASLAQANKEAAERRRKLDSYEKAEAERKQAEMTELERMRAQFEEVQTRAAQLEREKLQRQAAEQTGLPPALASRIQGASLDEMLEDAKGIFDVLPKDAKAPKMSATNPGAGAAPKKTDQDRLRELFGPSFK
jgi:hypothetical protein